MKAKVKDINVLATAIAEHGGIPSLSKESGIPKMSLYKVLRGEEVSPRTAQRVCKALNKSISDIFFVQVLAKV